MTIASASQFREVGEISVAGVTVFRQTLDDTLTINHYDQSEAQAWESGLGLQNLLTDLNSKYPGRVRLTAHSMGNIVAGEALRTTTQLVAAYAPWKLPSPPPRTTSRCPSGQCPSGPPILT